MTTLDKQIWAILDDCAEDYEKSEGKSAYVMERVPTPEYVRWAITFDGALEMEDEEVSAWYDKEVAPELAQKRAPEIKDLVQRVINVYFIKEYKFFFNKNNKKNSVDYVLNVDKVIDEKMQGAPPLVFNSVQTFMLNYEIKKLLDKVITIANEKYDNIVYINGRMSANGVLNVIGHLEKSYPDYQFSYVLLDRDNEFAEVGERCNKVHITKSLF
jgi:hypothetical protein